MIKELEELGKAIALGHRAVEVLQKSHVKEHTRTSASGAVSQVAAYDDKRQKAAAATSAANTAHSKVNIDRPASMMTAAEEHNKAARAHIDALKEAHASGKGNEEINEHDHAASRHLQAAHSLRSFHKDHAERHAKDATETANHLTAAAYDHDTGQKGKEATDRSLNAGSALHLMAKESHDRAAEAHLAIANKHFGTDKGQKHIDVAMGHRDKAAHHGKEIQAQTGVSIRARDFAHSLSEKAKKSGKKEDHADAAHMHHVAASLDWDSETKAEHEASAKDHEAKAK